MSTLGFAPMGLRGCGPLQPFPMVGKTMQHRRKIRRHRGATSVEFAMVAVPLFLFLFATIEFGRAMMALASMEEAARGGVRRAILPGATIEVVEDEVQDMMSLLGLAEAEYTVEITPADLSSQEQWSAVTVTISTTYDNVSWLPMPGYLGDTPLSASSTLPKESEPE